jgi:hypothetical protein
VSVWILKRPKVVKHVATQTIRLTTFRNFNLKHPSFRYAEVNSLFVLCKNHFFIRNLDSPKWARYREIYGPSKILTKKKRTFTNVPIHKKLYLTGSSYRTGNLIIPNINIESMLSHKWAHCTLIILTTGYKRAYNLKIIINQEKLKLCFFVKLFLSYKTLISPVDSIITVHHKINKMLNTDFRAPKIRRFLEKEGNLLAYLFDELSELGLNLEFSVPVNRNRENIFSKNKVKIEDFHNYQNNELFKELINLSCIGASHMF